MYQATVRLPDMNLSTVSVDSRNLCDVDPVTVAFAGLSDVNLVGASLVDLCDVDLPDVDLVALDLVAVSLVCVSDEDLVEGDYVR